MAQDMLLLLKNHVSITMFIQAVDALVATYSC